MVTKEGARNFQVSCTDSIELTAAEEAIIRAYMADERVADLGWDCEDAVAGTKKILHIVAKKFPSNDYTAIMSGLVRKEIFELVNEEDCRLTPLGIEFATELEVEDSIREREEMDGAFKEAGVIFEDSEQVKKIKRELDFATEYLARRIEDVVEWRSAVAATLERYAEEVRRASYKPDEPEHLSYIVNTVNNCTSNLRLDMAVTHAWRLQEAKADVDRLRKELADAESN